MLLHQNLLAATRSPALLVVALTVIGMAFLLFLDESIISTITQSTTATSTGTSMNKLRRFRASNRTITPTIRTSSCTQYRSYPFPQHHSGLPYLGDVFSSPDGQYVNFIGVHRGECREEWLTSDAFSATPQEQHRFMCIFQKDAYVLSDFVHPAIPHRHGFIIRCKIPRQYQHLVSQGQPTTTLHVDLHAMEDLEANRTGLVAMRQYPSIDVKETPSIPDIPVCHSLMENDKQLRPNQFNMTAFTRIKSIYALSHHLPDTNATMSSQISRMEEWIDYHKTQGFDHFIIYDNDEEPHGPIEKLLQPHIESGLVSYRWFPMKDCWVDYGGWKDYLAAEGQVVASLAALHRMGFTTKYFAHMDVDEFFVPLGGCNVLEMIEEREDSSVDAFEWRPTVMAPCNGTNVSAGGSVLSKWKCMTDQHHSDVKLIMRAERMFYFYVHYPLLTVDGTQPVVYRFNDENEGFLAHYRPEDDPNSSRSDTYSGPVINEFTNKVQFMDDFIKMQQENNTRLG